jgi:hypothetical protein
MSEKKIGDEFRTSLVCVDSYDDCVMKGRAYNPSSASAIPFESLMQFFLRMEDLLDEMKFPQSYTAKRVFSEPTTLPADSWTDVNPSGSIATFAVRILFRQNASWQGSVTWLEEQKEESFRSALELSLLLHSALTADNGL